MSGRPSAIDGLPLHERDAEGSARELDQPVAARARDQGGVRAPVGRAGSCRASVSRTRSRPREELKPQGINTILTRLGENLTKAEEAEEVTQHYLEVLDKVAAAGSRRAHLGQADAARTRSRPRAVRAQPRSPGRARRASATTSSGSTWRIPATSIRRSSCSGARGRRRARIGIAIQAYLYRTAKDIEALIPLGPAIRIVKGAYLEPPDIAYPKKSDVDENFYKLCMRLMPPDAQTVRHAAAHRDARRRRSPIGSMAYIAQHNVPASAYEFAMLYGIQRRQQLRLASEGKRLRVLISYGEYLVPVVHAPAGRAPGQRVVCGENDVRVAVSIIVRSAPRDSQRNSLQKPDLTLA